jgi:hypothetical protein
MCISYLTSSERHLLICRTYLTTYKAAQYIHIYIYIYICIYVYIYACSTRSLSDLLDKLLRPFVNKVKFRIKDTWDFLRKLPEDALEGDFTVTADISSLYTNITT